jgi:primosomal protein N' (replication factor Y) (superfamily II helicase)
MHYYKVAPLSIVREGTQTLTYSSETQYAYGSIVAIPVGAKQFRGIVVESCKKPDFPVKPISSQIIDSPLSKEHIKLAFWMSEYYHTPVSKCLQLLIPRGLEKKRRIAPDKPTLRSNKSINYVLTNEQSSAIRQISSSLIGGTFLLHGATGSGKTLVYIELIKKCIHLNRSCILLVPEIALTSQLISELNRYFHHVILVHSTLTESMRCAIWKRVIASSQPMIIVGPRSALFQPVKDIGLIIIDEAHDSSYKQDQSPKYSALRLASILGKMHKAAVVFGSATPSITDRFLADTQERTIHMREKAIPNTAKSATHVVSLTDKSEFTRHRFLSNRLLDEIDSALKNNKQALIYHNRRGSANVSLCERCGWVHTCPVCNTSTSLHHDIHQLVCHICGYKSNVAKSCPECHSPTVIHKGVGTKLIESELKKLYPSKTISRFDADNKSDETINNNYEDVRDGKIDIIVGTQIIAKGFDLPNLATVGVVQADSGLHMPDYISAERVFQLLYQVVGRVGRNQQSTSVVIQAFRVDHPSIQLGIEQQYEQFYKTELSNRKKQLFPPYVYLLKITCVYKTERTAIQNSRSFAKHISSQYGDISVAGPAPAFYEKVADKYRWQLIVKSKSRQTLLSIIDNIPTKNWYFDIDPISLL